MAQQASVVPLRRAPQALTASLWDHTASGQLWAGEVLPDIMFWPATLPLALVALFSLLRVHTNEVRTLQSCRSSDHAVQCGQVSFSSQPTFWPCI